MRNQSQSYGASPAIWDYAVFVTCRQTQVNLPGSTPAKEAATRFTYPR